MLIDVQVSPAAPRILLAFAAAALLCPALLGGCNAPVAPAASPSRALTEEHQALTAQVRQQLAQLPAPTKSQYFAVKNLSMWDNPYLTVQDGMLVMHVTAADANTSGLGEGGMLRPRGARRQDLTIRVGELTAALNAVPPTAWPYGRVIAVEEAHNAPASARPEVRRTIEVVMRTLNDVGVVAYEWPESGPGLR